MRSEGRLAKRQTHSRYGCSLQVRQLSHSRYGCATKVRKVSTNIWFLSPRKSPEPFLIDWYDFSDQVRLTGPWAIFVTALLFRLAVPFAARMPSFRFWAILHLQSHRKSSSLANLNMKITTKLKHQKPWTILSFMHHLLKPTLKLTNIALVRSPTSANYPHRPESLYSHITKSVSWLQTGQGKAKQWTDFGLIKISEIRDVLIYRLCSFFEHF